MVNELKKGFTENKAINSTGSANQMYLSMLRWQLLATVVVAVIVLLFAGIHASLSVVAGGFSVIIGAYLASKIAAKNSSQEAASVLINLLKAEATKIVVIAVLLFVVFKFYEQLVPLALIAGLAAAALFSGAALAKSDQAI